MCADSMGFVLSTPQGSKMPMLDGNVFNYDEEVKLKNTEKRHRILVKKVVAGVDDKPTILEEHSEYLRYITPHFRAGAIITVPPLKEDEKWQFGFIQGCTNMEFYNYYGEEGYTSWEFPEIEMGHFPMISDSDGCQFPWYGASKRELHTVNGPTTKQEIRISMHDNFYPQVTWAVPSQKCSTNEPRLSSVHRHQNFYTWLVAKNVSLDRYYVLKTMQWKANIEIAVNPFAEVGKRSCLIRDEFSRRSKECLVDSNKLIPKHVLFPPNANSAQTLIWRSKKDGSANIVVPPQWTVLKYRVLFKRYSWLSQLVSKSMISKTRNGDFILTHPSSDDDLVQALEAFLNLRHNRKNCITPKHSHHLEPCIRSCE